MRELKLYSTIDCQINGVSIPSIKATKYKKRILQTLDEFDKGSSDSGLMDYIHNDILKKKILFAKASIEKLDKELFGVLICTLKESLTDEEIELLKDECNELYGDGWGEGFEQADIKIPNSYDILNVSFFFRYGSFFYKRLKYIEVETKDELTAILNSSNEIKYIAFQNIDFEEFKTEISKKIFQNCFFLGCSIPKSVLAQIKDDCHIYPKINLPFNPFINSLYSKETLLGGYELGTSISYEDTLDKKIYNHYIINGKEADNLKETLFRRLHDNSITDAMNDFLEVYNEKRIIAVMGGHSLVRSNKDYLKVAKISKKLTELGFLMISGGGPGAMEATHLGAWLAGMSEDDLNKSVNILSEAPSYKDELWLEKSYEVLKLFPSSKYESLGISTWLYGHEPPTPFASKIAKYFANSVREDSLLAIAKGGMIFAPGSAGTIQEIFQDATQNHYLSFGYASPMVFLNTDYWSNERPIYPLLKKMIEEKKYENMIISSYDNGEKIIKELQKFTK
jgi:predicted Rossmann-fold nucleotide-binding protein